MKLGKLAWVGSLLVSAALPVFAADAQAGLTAICNVVTLARGLAALISLGMLTYSGIMYMTSGNDPKKHGEAKTMVEYVILGIILVVLAYYIVSKIFAGSIPINDCPWA